MALREIEDLASQCELLSPEVAKSLRGKALRVGVSTDAVIRDVATAMLKKVVKATPVDTGQARANWQVSIASEVPEVPFLKGTVDPSGDATVSAGMATLAGRRVPGQAIFISNAAPYIEALDKGWSQQAPFGMTSLAMQAGRDAAANSTIFQDK